MSACTHVCVNIRMHAAYTSVVYTNGLVRTLARASTKEMCCLHSYSMNEGIRNNIMYLPHHDKSVHLTFDKVGRILKLVSRQRVH